MTYRFATFLVSGALLCMTNSMAAGEPLLGFRKIGGYDGGAAGAAEIVAYDAPSRKLFVVNGARGDVDVLDLSRPEVPRRLKVIDAKAIGAAVNSVAAANGMIALAIESSPKTAPGRVAIYRASDLALLANVPVGAQPDMLVFTPDGKHLLVANEGEPNSYGQPDSVDPEGSVTVIDLTGPTPKTRTADFRRWVGREAELIAKGVRIFGPGANAAQDLEPEYIAVSPDGLTAFVTLQENNAIARLDVVKAEIVDILPLGLKDHSRSGSGLDASDKDGPAINIRPWPIRGMYQPDAIAAVDIGGTNYLLTANEGDAREWPGFNEEVRVRALCDKGLDPEVFGKLGPDLLADAALGRLRVTRAGSGGSDGKNAAGECTSLHSFGARSFSIWTTSGQQIYDSGDTFEQLTRALPNVKFNASHDKNELDARSPSKGPEPEGVAIATLGGRPFAFIGLERVGGVMAFDLSDPRAPIFAGYVNSRDGNSGDRGPEGLLIIDSAHSPNGRPLLVVGNEVSGTTSIYEIELLK